jgi:hypothetical protein
VTTARWQCGCSLPARGTGCSPQAEPRRSFPEYNQHDERTCRYSCFIWTAADRTLRYSCDMRTTNATTSVVTLSSWQQMLISALPLSSQQMKKTPRHSVGRTRRRFRHYTKKKCMQAGLHKNENFQDRRPWYQRGMRTGSGL